MSDHDDAREPGDDLWIPTPTELEEGTPRRVPRRAAGTEPASSRRSRTPKQIVSRLKRIVRKDEVLAARTEAKPARPAPAEDRTPEPPDGARLDTAPAPQEPPSRASRSTETGTATTGMPTDSSVEEERSGFAGMIGRVRRKRPSAPVGPPQKAPVGSLDRKKREAEDRAAQKGHTLGPFEKNPERDVWTATCAVCAATASVVENRPENHTSAASTYTLRGRAINWPCTS